MARKTVDKPFFIITTILVGAGFFIFSSAALGLLARGGIELSNVMFGQLIALLVGGVVLLVMIRIPYTFWQKYAFYIFIGSVLLTLAVFIPGIGFTHGGATRWFSIGPFSFQPAELLKVATVIYFAAWIAGIRGKIRTFSYGLVPLVILLAVIGGILALQPDLGTLLVIGTTVTGMFVIGGGKWSHLFLLFIVGALMMGLLSFFFPYVQARLHTFLDPSADALGAGYQIQQSLIAVGSGKLFGRGFGQSVQKFNFLPEPVGDSIFAVFAEEWGFVGALVLIFVFVVLGLRGLRIAARAPSIFTLLMVSGFVLLILVQSFVNMASMVGILPLTGMPLLLVSQGGSALVVTLGVIGIILNISRYMKNPA